ncbi:hypothetical protein Xen7305DRAFT_00035310 [Xenococcus sp. PCC 7305]|uniref:HetP family heterocyst commitment protein n=1 Tax=Xenococcus sp. PCC 7305 TaxID=102125 RepID=UPI0002AC98EC|nr:HetP family heterocyst commitment protein [Xenococcus sp. PCC 7305]ELS03807.1 hypothetical protein Xen7305DRAFT_00035310 [Xenococcus sp. PCC 7305]
MERNLSAFSDSKLNRAMTTEQFNEIVEAIISGKYSWACVLILNFAGYNPLHYIPYRTYNRLLKDNRVNRKSQGVANTSKVANTNSRKSQSNRNSSSQLRDLSYLEELKDCSAKVTGSNGWGWLWPQSWSD